MDQSVSQFDRTSIKYQALQTSKRFKPGFAALLVIMAVLMFSSANVLADPHNHSLSKKHPVIYNTPEGQFNGVPALEINGVRLHNGASNPTVTLSGLPATVLGMDTEGKQVIIEIPETLGTAVHFLTLDYKVQTRRNRTRSRHVVFYPYITGSGTGTASVPAPVSMPIPAP